MNKKSINKKRLITLLGCAAIILAVFFTCTPAGRNTIHSLINSFSSSDDSDDDAQITRQEAEQNCRRLITSYKVDLRKYEQYKDAETLLKQSWANEAKYRANHTAQEYNKYMNKQSVKKAWGGKKPSFIYDSLPYL